MPDQNPFARFGLSLASRDGLPTLTETLLWQLRQTHPEAYEERDGVRFVLLDHRYRLEPVPDRAFWLLVPAGDAPAGKGG